MTPSPDGGRRRRLLGIMMGGALVLSVASVATATTPATSSTTRIYGCVNKTTLVVRIVVHRVGRPDCRSNESAVSWNCVGPTGAAGATGAIGLTGPTGANGTNGTNGSNDSAGPAGPAGATGATGAAGTNGTNGTDGATGATGAPGTNGTNGTDGATGAAGPTGPQGATGPSGGPTGPTGPTGANGSDAPVYDSTGTPQTSSHVVIGTSATSTGVVTVTLAGSAVFTSSASYVCTVSNNSDPSALLEVSYTSGITFAITSGTAIFTASYICVGK